MAEQNPPQDDLKQQIWLYTGWAALLTTTLITGWIFGYLMWGDAPELRAKVEDLNGKLSKARSETETVIAQWGQKYRSLEREKEGLEKQMAQPPAAAPQ